MVEIPHLAWPLRLENGRLRVVEQGSIEDVRQCIDLLLVTPVGARPLSPEVGVPDPTFTAGIDPLALADLLTDEDNGEPRATVQITASAVSETGEQNVQIVVGLAADGDDIEDDEETVQL